MSHDSDPSAHSPGEGAQKGASRTVFRSVSGIVGSAIAAAIALVLLIDAVVRAGWFELFLLAPWVLLVIWAIWVAIAASYIRLNHDGVVVQNLLRRYRVPWNAISDITLRFQIVFTLKAGKPIAAIGGPAAGRPGRVGAAEARGDSRRVPPAVVALNTITDAWDDAKSRRKTGGEVVREWDRTLVWTLGVLVVWAVLAIFLAYS